jgi:hypothetical protein
LSQHQVEGLVGQCVVRLEAEKVEITWPSGIVQTLENVEADRIIKVTEPVPAPAAAQH